MTLDFYTPKSEILQQYIKGYYFISKIGNNKPIKYWTFPNNYCILTVNQNFSVSNLDNLVVIKSSPKENIMTCLVSRYVEPLQIQYEEIVDELTIYFKPLGINHFVDDTKEIFSDKTLIDFTFFPDFNAKIKEIFNLDRENQIMELESYLMSKLKIKNLLLMEQILIDIKKDIKIDEIAEKHNFTRQYINKLFLKNLGKSPSEFRKIQRFRNALLEQMETKNYTELSQSGFYDQSHFIKYFKELTHNKPRHFFKNVDVKKENIWFFC